MDWVTLLFYAITVGIATLSVERTMKVFFEKRRSSLTITVLSYVFLWLNFFIHAWWTVFIYFLALALVTLNYESVAMKRVAAVAGGHYIILSLTDMNVRLANFLPTTWFIGNEGLALILTSLFIYFVTLTVFPLFKHIKKSRL